MAIVAIAASLLSTIWCEAIIFKPSSSSDNSVLDDMAVTNSDGFTNLQFGLYYYSKIQNIDEETEEQDIFSNTLSCTAYGSDVNMDAAWKTARAFALIAPIVGGILTLGLIMSPCCIFFTRSTWNKVALMFLLVVPAFQSLTLLILASNACQDNPVIENRLNQWLQALGLDSSSSSSASSSSATAATATGSDITNSTADASGGDNSTSFVDDITSTTTDAEAALMGIYSDTCEWDWGTYANLASMILFFLTGVVMLLMGPPTRPDPKEPEMQTVTYQQTTNDNGDAVVQEVDVQTTNVADPVAETAQPGGPGWADTSHTAKPY